MLLSRKFAQRGGDETNLSNPAACTRIPANVRRCWRTHGRVAATPRRAELHGLVDALVGAWSTRRARAARRRRFGERRAAEVGARVHGGVLRIVRVPWNRPRGERGSTRRGLRVRDRLLLWMRRMERRGR